MTQSHKGLGRKQTNAKADFQPSKAICLTLSGYVFYGPSSIGGCPHPLMLGAAGRGGSGTALEFGGYWSRALHFWGNRSHNVKRRKGFPASKPAPLAWSCPCSSTATCSPQSLSTLPHWVTLGSFSPLTFPTGLLAGCVPTAPSAIMQKKMCAL